jgi:hypothetical protein
MTKLDQETIHHISELVNSIEVSYIMIADGYSEGLWLENRDEAIRELKQTYDIGRGA